MDTEGHWFLLYSHIDIDECETSSVMCASNASCMNMDGSYECTCDSGYSGDGLSCTGWY